MSFLPLLLTTYPATSFLTALQLGAVMWQRWFRSNLFHCPGNFPIQLILKSMRASDETPNRAAKKDLKKLSGSIRLLGQPI